MGLGLGEEVVRFPTFLVEVESPHHRNDPISTNGISVRFKQLLQGFPARLVASRFSPGISMFLSLEIQSNCVRFTEN